VLLDDGPAPGGPPSTIVDARARELPRLVRDGGDRVGARAKIARVMRDSAPRSARQANGAQERAALVGLFTGTSRHFDPEHSLDELAGLAAAAGATVVLRVLQERSRPDPATFLGSGKVASLAKACEEMGADVVIFDNELSAGAAAQPRGRARPQGARSDAAHPRHLRAARADAGGQAPGRAGAAAVPAAAPRGRGGRRSRGSAAASARGAPARPSSKPTAGGSGTASACCRPRSTASAGGAHSCASGGTRPRCPRSRSSATPTPARRRCSTADRRRRRRLRRAVRDARPARPPRRLPDRRELLVSDTVGFIERLPHSLVAAFRATLEEVAAADLLLHVIDASSPDRERHMDAVRERARRGGGRARPRRRGLQQVRPARRGRTGAYPGALPRRAVRLGADGRRARRLISSRRWKGGFALDTRTIARPKPRDRGGPGIHRGRGAAPDGRGGAAGCGVIQSAAGCVGVRQGAAGCVGVRRGASGCVGVRRGAAGCVGVRRGASGCVRVRRGASGCCRVRQGLPRRSAKREGG
jgi:GTPase